MGKPVCEGDVAFIKEKFDFNQNLHCIPFSFNQHADRLLENTTVVTESAAEACECLVEHFDC